MVQRIEHYLSKGILFILVLQGVGLVALIGIEVLFRYVIGRALSWPEEVAGIVFVWFTLCGVAVVMQEDAHISFDFLTSRLPAPLAKAVSLFSYLIVVGYALIMVYVGYGYARMFSFETTPAANINLLWLTLALPVSGGLICLYGLLKIVELFTPFNEEPTAP